MVFIPEVLEVLFYLPEETIYAQASTDKVHFRPDWRYKTADFNEEISTGLVKATICFNSTAEAEAAGYTFADD